MLSNNPVIKRYFFSALRPRHLWIYSFIYITFIAVVLLINFTTMNFNENRLQNAQILYFEFFLLQVLILWFMAGYNTGSAIRDEILNKTYDFFKLIPIPSRQKATGIFIGKNMVPFLIAAINFLFMCVFGSMGKLTLGYQLQIVVFLVCGTLFFNAAALLSSTIIARFRRSSNPAYLFILYFILMPYMFLPMVFLSNKEGVPDVHIQFFTFSVPLFLFLGFLAFYFAAWLFKGIIIKLDNTTDPLFDRKGVCLFLLGYIVILAGIILGQIPLDQFGTGYISWIISAIPLFILPFGVQKSLMHYMEGFGGGNDQSGKDHPGPGRFLGSSNLRSNLELFGIWAVFALGAGLITGMDSPHILHHILVFFSFWSVIVLIIELANLLTPKIEKIKYLFLFIVFLLLILPLIFGGILETRSLIAFSLVGYLTEFAESNKTQFYVHYGIFIMNFIFSGILLGFILNRYAWIRRAREEM